MLFTMYRHYDMHTTVPGEIGRPTVLRVPNAISGFDAGMANLATVYHGEGGCIKSRQNCQQGDLTTRQRTKREYSQSAA